MNTAIVSGVGAINGIGAQLCLRFAKLGMHVFAASRTQANLDAVVSEITAQGGSATSVVADATDEQACIALFSQARATGEIALAIYNTGNNTPGRIEDMSAEFFEASWRVCCLGGFLFGREAVKHMKKDGGGTLLFTGASASLRGRPNFGAFNSSKGALRNLANAMAKEYGEDLIHVGHIIIDGPVDGNTVHTRYPEYAAKMGEHGMISIEAIVDCYEFLYKQPRRGWSFEIDARTAVENW